MFKHDDKSYIKTTWEQRYNQMVNAGKNPGNIYSIVEFNGIDHNGNPVKLREVYCEFATFKETNGDTWVYSDLESSNVFDKLKEPELAIVDKRGKLAARGPYSKRSLSGINGITLHYTAGNANMSVEDLAAMQINLVADASTGEKFPAIAYTIVVDGNGQVNLCHDLDTRSWHSAAIVNGVSWNTTRVSVCYTGNTEPNDMQIHGINTAIKWVREQLGKNLPVDGHRDVYATLCPGNTWNIWKDKLI